MTNSKEKTELFELCKEVYERSPEWGIDTSDQRLYHFDRDGDIQMQNPRDAISFNSSTCVPLYTSDYILEKLPKLLKHPAAQDEEYTVGVSWHIDKKEWVADYERSMIPHAYADTPLKALLRLTIALDDAGSLK